MKRLAAVLVLAAGLTGKAEAHRLDEYLQATLIGVTRQSVEVQIQLTPGVAVLPVVMASIDRNGDGLISADEERAYAATVAHEVELRRDGRAVPLSLVESSFPGLAEMQAGLGSIRLRLRAEGAGEGHELRFENRHLPQVSVYLVNCLAEPADGLVVSRQERDEWQRSLRFGYSFGGDPANGESVSWERLGLALIGTLLAARLAMLWRRGRNVIFRTI